MKLRKYLGRAGEQEKKQEQKRKTNHTILILKVVCFSSKKIIEQAMILDIGGKKRRW